MMARKTAAGRKRAKSLFDETLAEKRAEANSAAMLDLRGEPADYTLELIHQKVKKQEIVVPPFQRAFVWPISRSAKLVDSFLQGLPVPAVYLFQTRQGKLEIIDGHQRIGSVCAFFDGMHPWGADGAPTKREFRLSDKAVIAETAPWWKQTYDELGSPYAERFQNSVMRAYILRETSDTSRRGVFHVFERLNTGGVALKNQEVRNCVYQGSLNSLLHELNALQEWRDILGSEKPDKHLRDVELILRFISFLDRRGEYRKPLHKFLTNFMADNIGAKGVRAREWSSAFRGACEVFVREVGPRPFHVKGVWNAAVMDCSLVAVAKARLCGVGVNPNLKACFASMVEDPGFKRAVESATTDESAVKTRFDLAEERLINGGA